MKPPKDRLIIIQSPFSRTVAKWSETDNAFVYANPQTELYDGKWNMHYFENECIKEQDIKEWSEI